ARAAGGVGSQWTARLAPDAARSTVASTGRANPCADRNSVAGGLRLGKGRPGMSTVTDQTTALDRAAALQQGTKRFSAFYERHAYLVYNLSLRITCDRAVAIESSRAAFLASVAAPDPDEGLVKTAVSQALAVAPHQPADPKGAGDADAEAMLRATAVLTPAERATLALTDVAGASTIKIGQ